MTGPVHHPEDDVPKPWGVGNDNAARARRRHRITGAALAVALVVIAVLVGMQVTLRGDLRDVREASADARDEAAAEASELDDRIEEVDEGTRVIVTETAPVAEWGMALELRACAYAAA